jgi:sec-independent protein translocase protein TatB
MLDVGFSEILLTSAIALIVLGPERLPKVARQVGNWMGRARAMARQLSEQLEREVSAEELLKTQSKPSPSANLPSGGTASPSSGAASPSSGAASPGGGTSGAAFDPAYTPSIAPPARAPEPVHGLDAASTTAAAMHANDPPVAAPVPPAADPTPAATHTPATDAKPPHE